MTQTRVIAALIMAPLAICAIVLLPTQWLAALAAILFLTGLWEWLKLSGIDDSLPRTVLLMLNLLLMVLLVWADGSTLVLFQITTLAGVAWWLAALAWLGVPGFAPEGEQSTFGLLASALTFTFNLYEGRTGWAPAGWDVLWSLSIEEAFYLGFPLLCLWLPRKLLVGVLLLWALALSPLRDLVPPQDEVWRGMAAIAWGVLAALLARRWSPSRGQARAMAVCGALCLVLAFVWSDVTWRHLYQSGLYWLCLGACLLLLAFHAHPPASRARLTTRRLISATPRPRPKAMCWPPLNAPGWTAACRNWTANAPPR